MKYFFEGDRLGLSGEALLSWVLEEPLAGFFVMADIDNWFIRSV